MGNYDGTFRKWFKITQDPKTTEFDGEWVTVNTTALIKGKSVILMSMQGENLALH